MARVARESAARERHSKQIDKLILSAKQLSGPRGDSDAALRVTSKINTGRTPSALTLERKGGGGCELACGWQTCNGCRPDPRGLGAVAAPSRRNHVHLSCTTADSPPSLCLRSVRLPGCATKAAGGRGTMCSAAGCPRTRNYLLCCDPPVPHGAGSADGTEHRHPLADAVKTEVTVEELEATLMIREIGMLITSLV